jgi:hypothetical protein
VQSKFLTRLQLFKPDLVAKIYLRQLLEPLIVCPIDLRQLLEVKIVRTNCLRQLSEPNIFATIILRQKFVSNLVPRMRQCGRLRAVRQAQNLPTRSGDSAERRKLVPTAVGALPSRRYVPVGPEAISL